MVITQREPDMMVQESTPAQEATLWRFTAADYHRMSKLGILPPDCRTELLNGQVYKMAAIGNRHLSIVNDINAFFVHSLGDKAIVSIQNPVRLSETSEPEADIAILRPHAHRYREAGPFPADVLLLIEVADSSLRTDRDIKMPLYAGAGITELWIVDAARARVRIYRDPNVEAAKYREVRIVNRTGTMSPLAFPDLVVKVTDMTG